MVLAMTAATDQDLRDRMTVVEVKLDALAVSSNDGRAALKEHVDERFSAIDAKFENVTKSLDEFKRAAFIAVVLMVGGDAVKPWIGQALGVDVPVHAVDNQATNAQATP